MLGLTYAGSPAIVSPVDDDIWPQCMNLLRIRGIESCDDIWSSAVAGPTVIESPCGE